MKDPVTVSTGITYDRENIEKWLFAENRAECPVTKRPLSDSTDLIPNHTLRRLIQAWCTMNASHGVQRIPTPRVPISKSHVTKLLKDATKSPQLLSQCIRTLRKLALESESNKRCIEAAGAVEFLASVMINHTTSSTIEISCPDEGFEFRASVSDEALTILHNLRVSEGGLRSLIHLKNGEVINSLMRVMQRGYHESRAHAVHVLKFILQVADPQHTCSAIKPELLVELVYVLRDQISSQASKAALKILIQTCPWGKNKLKVVEAGAVSVLVELLINSQERRPTEMILVILDILCSCAEGRAELLSHAAGLAVVANRILRVSTMATEKAVRILFYISKYSATPAVVQEMAHLGVVAKLGLVVEMDSGRKAKDRAVEILKMHVRAWRNSPCVPSQLAI